MRLKILLVFFLLITFIKPTNSYAWWGINEADKKYCMDVASNEKNEFSAKLSYKACLKEHVVDEVFVQNAILKIELSNKAS